MESLIQCSYIGCGKEYAKGLRFHLIPVKNPALCVKWLINSGLEEFLSQESDVLESMNLSICSDHFQESNYINEKTLKEGAIPRQYWDHGYSDELGEIKETNIDQHLSNYSDDDCLTSIDSESDSDNESGDEFQTQLGNEIEVLLNSIQNSAGRTKREKKINFGESLRGFYKKLNSKGNRFKDKTDHSSINDLIEFKRATKNMCRTCAEIKNNLVDVADEAADTNIGILTKLKLLIDIKDQDVLPKKICQECLTKLEKSYEFFQQIYKADNTLRDMLFACDRSGKTASNKSKYNGHRRRAGNFKSIKSSSDNKTEDNSSDINDLPFQTIFENTGGIDNGVYHTATANVYESNHFYRRMNDSNNIRDKSSLHSEACSSENTENTVSYLLSDFSDDDAELSWLDVVGVMEKKQKSEASKTDKTALDESLTRTVQISCKYCDKSFKLRRQLKTHITMKHIRPTDCVCEYCNVCCRSRQHLSKHLDQVHFTQRYKCNDCNEKFPNKKNLRLHIERIHSEICTTAEMDITPTPCPDQTYTCIDCQETFSSKKILSNHIHRLHPPFAYTCTICKSVIYSEEDTYKHMSTHNQSPLFPCLDCGRMFYSTERLEKHKIAHAKSMQKKRKKVWFHCQLCDASYSVVDGLIKHIETHSSEDWDNYRNKILYCGECNARIIGKEKFRIHKMRYHLAKRGDFICLLCGDVSQDFTSLGDYKKHIESHSNELKCSAPQKYRCEHCNKAFQSNSHRMNHAESFHSDLMQSCPIINDVKLNNDDNLKDHINEARNTEEPQVIGAKDSTEEQIPPQICEEESVTVVEKNIDHEETREEISKDLEKSLTEPEQCICDQCDSKFSSMDILRQHILDAHGDTEKYETTDTHRSENNTQSEYTEGEKTSEQKIVLEEDVAKAHSDIEHTCSKDVIKPELENVSKEPLLTDQKEESSYKCQYCEKQFDNDEDKKNHEVNQHSNNMKSNGEDLSSQDHK